MRAAIAIVIVILTLGLVYEPAPAQTQAGDLPALESIRMVDALTGWAVTHEQGENALLRTTNGGTQWREVTPLSSSRQQIAVFRVAVLTSLIAWVLSSEETQIFHTIDGGRTWRHVTIPAQGGEFQFINARDGWMLANEVARMGSEEVDIYRSTDGGKTWSKVASTTVDNERSGLPFIGDKVGITFLNVTTGWITGTTNVFNSLYLYVTHDGGRTWRQQKLSLPPQVTSPWDNWTKPPRFFTARDGILPVFYGSFNPRSYSPVASPGVFYVTHDGGTTWMYTTPVSLIQCDCPWSFADMNHGWRRAVRDQ
jgi:photosystem II stability/assembly factor-like uncharacterized protein